jgi:hypothetical protein
MGYRAERRMLAWVAGLERWATIEAQRETDKWEREYLSGVSAAVALRMGSRGPIDSAESTLHEVMGHDDANALIRKVVVLGDAPTGDYRALLTEPRSRSIAR